MAIQETLKSKYGGLPCHYIALLLMYKELSMSDIKKVMISLVALCSFIAPAGMPVPPKVADAHAAPTGDAASLPLTKWLAYALMAVGGVGYGATELKLHLDAKKNAGVRVLKDSETPELTKRQKLMRLQKIFQWLLIGGTAVRGAVFARDLYKEVKPAQEEAEKQRIAKSVRIAKEAIRAREKKRLEAEKEAADALRVAEVKAIAESVTVEDFSKKPYLDQLQFLTDLLKVASTFNPDTEKKRLEKNRLEKKVVDLMLHVHSVKYGQGGVRLITSSEEMVQILNAIMHPDKIQNYLENTPDVVSDTDKIRLKKELLTWLSETEIRAIKAGCMKNILDRYKKSIGSYTEEEKERLFSSLSEDQKAQCAAEITEKSKRKLPPDVMKTKIITKLLDADMEAKISIYKGTVSEDAIINEIDNQVFGHNLIALKRLDQFFAWVTNIFEIKDHTGTSRDPNKKNAYTYEQWQKDKNDDSKALADLKVVVDLKKKSASK